jgi:hypothetical protein
MGNISNKQNIKWKNENAKKYYKYTTKWLGKPNITANKMVIWDRNILKKYKYYGYNICFYQIIIKDESIKHNCPTLHDDFIYISVKIYIPEDKLINVLKLPGSIYYDPYKQLLITRCGSIQTNIVLLKLATDVAIGNINYKTVHEQKLYSKSLIKTYDYNSKDKTNHSYVKSLYLQLSENLKKSYFMYLKSTSNDYTIYSNKYKFLQQSNKEISTNNKSSNMYPLSKSNNNIIYPTNIIKSNSPLPKPINSITKDNFVDYDSIKYMGGSGGFPYGIPKKLYIDGHYQKPLIYL